MKSLRKTPTGTSTSTCGRSINLDIYSQQGYYFLRVLSQKEKLGIHFLEPHCGYSTDYRQLTKEETRKLYNYLGEVLCNWECSST